VNRLRTTLAIVAARLSACLSQRLGKGSGTSLPGKVALVIQPTILATLCHQIPKSIVITGTNGKSTTSGLVAGFLKARALTVAHNLLGANMRQGIITALMQQSSVHGQLHADVGVFEVDEATLPLVAPDLNQRVTVVTNLFRDQLDRYGELDTTANYIKRGVKASVDAGGLLVLNADDPIVVTIGFDVPPEQVIYYGLSSELGQAMSVRPLPPLLNAIPNPKEVTDCPKCQARLDYHFTVYGHLGHYQCPQCGFERPRPHIMLETLETSLDGSVFSVRHAGLAAAESYQTHLRGRFNLYNVLGAIAGVQALLAISERELPTFTPSIQQGLNDFHSIFGRSESRVIDGKRVEIYLIKNPMGAAEVLETVAQHRQRRCVLVLNDNAADGKDVSWIWDAPFEWLAEDPLPITVSGHRAEDLALRLAYAGLSPDFITVVSDPWQALQETVASTAPDEVCFVLPTYTALLELSQRLKSR
jgi:lipid II isoglutaminyl synthase (glutamine-hydrolysing)